MQAGVQSDWCTVGMAMGFDLEFWERTAGCRERKTAVKCELGE